VENEAFSEGQGKATKWVGLGVDSKAILIDITMSKYLQRTRM